MFDYITHALLMSLSYFYPIHRHGNLPFDLKILRREQDLIITCNTYTISHQAQRTQLVNFLTLVLIVLIFWTSLKTLKMDFTG